MPYPIVGKEFKVGQCKLKETIFIMINENSSNQASKDISQNWFSTLRNAVKPVIVGTDLSRSEISVRTLEFSM